MWMFCRIFLSNRLRLMLRQALIALVSEGSFVLIDDYAKNGGSGEV